MLYDIQELLKTSKSKPRTTAEIIKPINDFRRGANWVLTLLDLEASKMEASEETQLFISDFINRTKGDL